MNLAPWYYRNLVEDRKILESISVCQINLFSSQKSWEAVVKLNDNLVARLDINSYIYSDADGSGTSIFKNEAIYKAISEALERWAFYAMVDSEYKKKYCFDLNPSTTGMAAFPSLFQRNVRLQAIFEASERWAVHEFWRGKLPIYEHHSQISKLRHFEILTNLKNSRISLLCFEGDNQYLYSFAAASTLEESKNHALVELSRNLRVFEKFKRTSTRVNDFSDINDRRIFYFSTKEGYELFNQKILSAPNSINAQPSLICDKEISGPWSKYTKVWRYLYADSYPEDDTDHTFFMF